MTQLSSMDLYYLVEEFQFLVSGKVNQIYQKEKEELLIDFHVTSKGKQMLKITLPSMIYLTQYKSEQPQTPPGFCTFLRRRLKNARLQKIQQIEFERILRLDFSTKDQTYIMFIELFANGNIILCDESLKIISPLQTGNWKDRTIRGGIQYEYPKRIDSLNISKEETENILKNSKKESIVKSLAIELGFGGNYSEKICELAKVDKESKDIKGIYEAIQKLKTTKPKHDFTSFNEFLDETLTKDKIKSIETEQVSKKEKAVNKVQKVIDQQTAKIKEFETNIEKNQKIGEYIYHNYQKIKEILEDPEKHGKINKKDKIVEVEI